MCLAEGGGRPGRRSGVGPARHEVTLADGGRLGYANEHWANALHQPQAAARAMLGQQVSYDRLPYFFTDQYDLGMEYSGYVPPGGHDQVVLRGDVAGRQFPAFWLSGGRVLAGMNVNIWDQTDAIQALVRSGQPVPAGRLADPEQPLAGLLPG